MTGAFRSLRRDSNLFNRCVVVNWKGFNKVTGMCQLRLLRITFGGLAKAGDLEFRLPNASTGAQ
jgi:hypothetical protein